MAKIKYSPDAAFWLKHIEAYEQDFNTWVSQGKKIVKRYKNDRTDSEKKQNQFNILYSNVQTLAPSLYSQPPNPNIEPRKEGDDPLGRAVSLCLESAVSYYIKTDNFDDAMTQAVLDRLLPGRGTCWVRYVPNFVGAPVAGSKDTQADGSQITDDLDTDTDLESEDVVLDYVNWEDFGHTWGRTWQEVRAVWRKVYLDKKALRDRFGEDAVKKLAADGEPSEGETKQQRDKYCVYEIWDKQSAKVFWLSKSCPDLLDERSDPLGLDKFFPCPKPMYSLLANDCMKPTPDYMQYQDQAAELDMITARVDLIVQALKVMGVYDASQKALERLLSEGTENKLIPVDNWAMFSEKGGLKGVIDFVPFADLVATVQALYQARDQVKQTIYEITGISDIVRGTTDPNETLGAQELKGQFATMRLDSQRKDVQRFARDVVRMMAEIIADHFSLDTIKKVSGIALLTEQEKQQISQAQAQWQQAAQQAEQAQQPPPPKPDIPEEILELLNEPSWEQVEQVLRDDLSRSFLIDIETDSTIKADQRAEQQAMVEFLGSAGPFLKEAVLLPPDVQPLAMEMLMSGVRSFRAAKTLESAFRTTMDKMQKAAENPQPQPDPARIQAEMEQAKVQSTEKMEGAKLQVNQQIEAQRIAANKEIEAQKLQATMQIEEMKLQVSAQLEQQKAQAAQLMEQQKMAFEAEKLQRANEHDFAKHKMTTKATVSADQALTDPDLNDGVPLGDALNTLGLAIQELAQGQAASIQVIAQGQAAILEAVSKPKVATITDAKGNIVRKGTVE